MAEGLGFEPRFAGSKPAVLPLRRSLSKNVSAPARNRTPSGRIKNPLCRHHTPEASK